jgi:hypothetical protein
MIFVLLLVLGGMESLTAPPTTEHFFRRYRHHLYGTTLLATSGTSFPASKRISWCPSSPRGLCLSLDYGKKDTQTVLRRLLRTSLFLASVIHAVPSALDRTVRSYG